MLVPLVIFGLVDALHHGGVAEVGQERPVQPGGVDAEMASQHFGCHFPVPPQCDATSTADA